MSYMIDPTSCSRVSDEEDGDLSEVQSDAVPTEVRKWLETTFTRNSISQKRRTDDKLKFRSVANAIRAGIVVDRIYRRMSASTPFVSQEVSQLLKSIDDWSFNCFQINQVSSGQVLKSVGYELFNRYGLMYKFKIPTTTLKNFLTQIESGYTKHKNPYHNNLHAADVTQTVHYMLWQAGLTNWLTDLEIFATLLAAIIHDYLHTGTTNNFHVMSQSETALIYNDRAVLENFHISQAFQLMKNEDCNILAGLSKDEYRGFRSLVIDMVLATDMSSHFQQIKAMKNILNHADNFNADKSKILSLVIHISDISHPAKDWELHSQWTNLLMEEFFRQGDREKELDLECSPLCDRETTLVAESQLGFIEFIVSPSLEICGDVLDRVHYQMAEANTRPVLPASAKAVSVFAAASTAVAAKITGPPPVANKSAEPNSGPEASSPVPPETPTTSRPTSVAATISTSTTSQDKNSSRNSSTLASSARNSTSDHNNHQQQQDTVTASNSSGSGNRQTVTTTSGSGVSIRSQQQQPKQQQQQQQQPLPRLPNRQLSGSSIDNASQSTASARTSVQHQSSVASSASSFASSFVSSDTIASNLRKMIASSSASISRKLNITTGSIGSMSAASSNSTNSLPMSPTATTTGASPPPPLPPPPTTTIVSTSGIVGNERRESASEQKTETVAEFEARQANYRHPVIQCNPSSPIQSRPKSSMVNRSAQMGTAAESNQQQQQQQLQSQRLQANSGDTSRSQPGSSLIAVTATEPKSSSDSLVAVNTNEQGLEMKWSAGIATRSAPPLQYFKIQRPWVACLERNKKMWRERSLLEGKKG